MADVDLERILGFEAADLPYNRRGERSPRQLAQMRSDSRGCLVRLLIVNGLAAAFMIGARLIGPEAFEQVGVFALPVVFLAGPWLILSLLPTPTSIYVIKSAEGEAKLSMGYARGRTRYYMLVVDGVDFNIPQALYNALEEGERVAVYYTATSGQYAVNHLVSLERL